MYTKSELAEASLYEFFKQAWHVIEGDLELEENWHLEAIAEHLEAVYYRKIKNLLINIPPRTAKTTLVSIVFPAWVWLHKPEEKFLFASCANNLSLEIADKSRTLIESEWFKKRWGSIFQIRKDQSAKGYFSNNRTGYRISTSVGSHVVGRGGSIQITDDPNPPGGESALSLKSTLNWWSTKWFNRLNDIRKDARILVQQRSDENDISGFLKKNDINNEWTKLILPLEFESKNCTRTVSLDDSDTIWQDPRKKEGEILTSRISAKELKQIKSVLGSYQYASQYQQRPVPLNSGIIKKNWFKLYQSSKLPRFIYKIQSWDTALTARDSSSYSASTTWGVFLNNRDKERLMLLATWRGKLEYPELRRRIKKLSEDYRAVDDSTLPREYKYTPDQVVIEAKASGNPLMQDLSRAGVTASAFNPSKYGDKMQRVKIITALIEGGLIYVPSQKHDTSTIADFADEFIASISTFPSNESYDFVDTMTQALIVLRNSGRISHPHDYDEPEDEQEIQRVY